MRPLPRLILFSCLLATTLPALAQAQGLGSTAADRLRSEQQNRVLSRSNPTLGAIDRRLDLQRDRTNALISGDPADLGEAERRRRLLLLERQRELSEVDPLTPSDQPTPAPDDGSGARTSVSGAPGAP